MTLDARPARAAASQSALAELVEAVRQLEGLTGQVGPFALYPEAGAQAPELVAAVCRELAVPLTFDAPARGRDRDFAVVALAAEIQHAQRSPALRELCPQAAAAAARRLRADEESRYRRHAVRRPDGAVVTAVEAGPPSAHTILISAPCALSYRLSLPWLRALRSSYHCVVAQTRGTGEQIEYPAEFDRRGYGVPDQVEDLLAVIDALATGPVHVMGLCGGAAVALAAAARRPEQVRSISLWHADVDLAGKAEKTDHQINLREMLDLAGESRDTAGWLRDKLTSGPMTGVPERIGPLVIRPYATTELFYRYAKLTGATMHWDSGQTAAEMRQRCLLVTSANDGIAHPGGSRKLAEMLPGARLVMADHGTHLDAFRASATQVSCLRSFLER